MQHPNPRRSARVQIDKSQLDDLSQEADQLHHESMRTIREEFAEIHFGEVVPGHRNTRRSFLGKAGAGGALLTVGSMVMPLSRLMPAAWAQADPSDADLAKFAAGLELAAVRAYKAAAGTGKLSAQAKAVGVMFAGHHQDHADALNDILGDQAVKAPNKTVLDKFGPMITGAKDEPAILEIARGVEEGAASTYLLAIGLLDDAKSAGALGTILPVESQHATVLATVLKKPASDYLIDFVTTDNALKPADYPAS
jgi:rubrerythrin